MLIKRLLEIFGANAQSKTKRGEIICKECNFIYANTFDECPDCKYMKILTDRSFGELSENLRVIKTIRGARAIKAAKEMGLKLIELRAEVSDQFKVKYKKMKDKLTGKIVTLGDFREDHYFRKSRYKTLVDWTSKNPSKFFSPFAAYIIPKDLESGERVLINDVITNHVSGSWNQGDVYRLSKSEATWNGRGFVIDVSSYTIGEFIG
jgi:hypothetical protein